MQNTVWVTRLQCVNSFRICQVNRYIRVYLNLVTAANILFK
jgi:hypothetical protein